MQVLQSESMLQIVNDTQQVPTAVTTAVTTVLTAIETAQAESLETEQQNTQASKHHCYYDAEKNILALEAVLKLGVYANNGFPVKTKWTAACSAFNEASKEKVKVKKFRVCMASIRAN